MKKVLIGTLSLLMCFALVGCGSEEKKAEGEKISNLSEAFDLDGEESVVDVDEIFDFPTEPENIDYEEMEENTEDTEIEANDDVSVEVDELTE